MSEKVTIVDMMLRVCAAILILSFILLSALFVIQAFKHDEICQEWNKESWARQSFNSNVEEGYIMCCYTVYVEHIGEVECKAVKIK